jgi:alkyl sulfatase BDS1-like metallo-beta-lactamase superfamily hydrolase
MNLRLTDTGDTALVQVKNSVIVYHVGRTSPTAAVSVEMPRKTLETLALNPRATLDGVVVTSGDPAIFREFVGMLDVFDPGFPIALP